MKNKLSLSTLLVGVVLTASAQTSERVMARSYGEYDGTTFNIYDSAHFVSSGDNGVTIKWADYFATAIIGNQIDNKVFLFDEQNQYLYNSAISAWEHSIRYTIINDTIENTRMETVEAYDKPSSSWKNALKYSYSFNDAGFKILEIFQNWDVSTSSWKNYSKAILTVDPSGNVTEKITQYVDYSTDAWYNYEKVQYAYAFGNQLSSTITQYWDADISSWKNSTKLTFNYSGTKISESYWQYWDATTLSWKNNKKFTYLADASGNTTEIAIKIWDIGTSSWVNHSKHLITYDANGNGKDIVDQYWDGGSSSYTNQRKYIFTYNPRNNLTSLSTQSWNPGGFWEYTVSSSKTNLFYETYTPLSLGDIVSQQNGTVNLYPSPASATITIDLQWDEVQRFSVQMIDAMGRIVKSWNQPASKTYKEELHIEGFASGNYWFIIRGEKGGVISKQVSVKN